MPTIVNVCLTGPYSDGFSYQDNLLPKYQRRLGYKVVVIAPVWRWGEGGTLEKTPSGRYENEDGIEIVRIENDQKKSVTFRFKTYGTLLGLLKEYRPEIIFLHGLQIRDSATICQYVQQNPETRLFVDNHADYSNSAQNWCSKYILHRLIWRYHAKRLEPLAEKFWGVLPARVDFLIDNYGISREKCDLLVMGADDDEVARASNSLVRSSIRHDYDFSEDDFVVVTGGKIDAAKYQTLLLMEAVHLMNAQVKLLIFGPVDSKLRGEFEERLDIGKMVYVPWAIVSESYAYFAAADAICFPGRHSVYWEQGVAMGKPLVVKRWAGTEHIDVCGNVIFLDSDGVGPIKNALQTLINDCKDAGSYYKAANIAANSFLYSEIAKRSIGLK